VSAYLDLTRSLSMGAEPRLVKLIIAGSRDLPFNPTADDIHDAIDRLLEEHNIVPNEIVSGNARGVDRAGEEWATSCGLKVTRFPVTPADWRTYGRFAGPKRNEQMAKYADALLAFWDGKSRGTRDMIDRMRARKRPVVTVMVKL